MAQTSCGTSTISTLPSCSENNGSAMMGTKVAIAHERVMCTLSGRYALAQGIHIRTAKIVLSGTTVCRHDCSSHEILLTCSSRMCERRNHACRRRSLQYSY
jgi:hypothetical protein